MQRSYRKYKKCMILQINKCINKFLFTFPSIDKKITFMLKYNYKIKIKENKGVYIMKAKTYENLSSYVLTEIINRIIKK